jgi:2-dehydro-3-deoxy-L-rhamnonate dehydrogenase (NAD+)
MANKIDCANRFAVVTGGAQGIGKAVAKRLISSGATVALWDADIAYAEKTAKEIGAVAFHVDVTNYENVVSATAQTLKTFGRIDILVNNAGIAGPNGPLADYALDDWNKVIAINLNGVFHCCKAVVPHMTKAGYGRIVNVASIAGKEGNPNASAYSASKAGVIALTKSLGKELADKNIAVNCVTPAAARTAIFDQMKPEFIAFMLSKIPRGRFVEVEEVAATIAFMASEDCSFTTGGVFDISGGRATY